MEIIFSDQSYDGEISEKEFIKEFEKDIKEFDENAKWKNADTGRGADWPVILAIYSSVMTTITAIPLLLDYARKFKNHFFKIENKYGKLRISEDCAELLALNYISENEKNVNKIDNILKKDISIDPPTKSKKTGLLDDNPDSYYVFIYNITIGEKDDFGEFQEKIYFFIIKSDGKFELSHSLDKPKWHNF